MKKEKAQLGLISSLFALAPILGILGMYTVADADPSSRMTDVIKASSLLIGFVISPVAGLTMGIISLIKKREPLILPLIGVILNSLWVIMIIVFIIMVGPILFGDGPII